MAIFGATAELPRHWLETYQRPEAANVALLEAALRGDAARCLAALNAGACPNYYGGDGGTTSVHVAAALGDVSALRAICDHVSDDAALVALLDVESTVLKARPLHFAAAAGSTACVEFLLRRGAAVDAPNAYGHTPLMLACSRNHGGTVRALVSAGAQACARSSKGETPLHMAVAGVAAAARAVRTDGNAHAPGDLVRVIEALLREPRIDANALDGHGATALHCVAQMQLDDAVACAVAKLLFQKKANCKLRDESGKRPSDYLVTKKSSTALLALLRQRELLVV
ncbi:ankyrin repeat-containing domain protein [Pelagophyceae sp. CCMP2097]|nr:ankyrin repeat-containing domain protein [Pelagophyceae sp. CCMP2097]